MMHCQSLRSCSKYLPKEFQLICWRIRPPKLQVITYHTHTLLGMYILYIVYHALYCTGVIRDFTCVCFVVEKDVKKLLKCYFDKYGKFNSESELSQLETVLTRFV